MTSVKFSIYKHRDVKLSIVKFRIRRVYRNADNIYILKKHFQFQEGYMEHNCDGRGVKTQCKTRKVIEYFCEKSNQMAHFCVI